MNHTESATASRAEPLNEQAIPAPREDQMNLRGARIVQEQAARSITTATPAHPESQQAERRSGFLYAFDYSAVVSSRNAQRLPDG